eukprot:4821385-Pleurochrysis_carterae.AAC.3
MHVQRRGIAGVYLAASVAFAHVNGDHARANLLLRDLDRIAKLFLHKSKRLRHRQKGAGI